MRLDAFAVALCCVGCDALSSLPCGVGARVWARTADTLGDSEWVQARVLRRDPGQAVVVQLLEVENASVNATLPPTSLRTRHGGLCARAALCFFGRVGNLHGKFDEAGSASEALEVSSNSVWENVIRANPDLSWDIFAHTWDEAMGAAIGQAYRPTALVAEAQPRLENVLSFAEACRRAAALKARKEATDGFRYDLVLLMRWDIFFRRPLRLSHLVPTDRLWTGHWCSAHAEDLSVREVVLNETRDESDIRSQRSGVFAPSQFATSGLHDFWFAASSENIDRFAAWGQSVPGLRERYGLMTDEIPVHVGHFYTFLHARAIGLTLGYTGLSYLDYTLVRYRECRIQAEEVIRSPDVFCSHWEISVPRQCEQWLPTPEGWAAGYCPAAGRRATLSSGSRGCGRF
ncbi:unnamed protein product [Polarella glacialis]|uniref:Protein xylosyltransferase n=1 Tax=Polarella glacialis TaxID=89957 RepID=A0A813HCD6_POLGL|nr:unnamed protein product [Polarella glacialis]